jgi:hypothetical protein
MYQKILTGKLKNNFANNLFFAATFLRFIASFPLERKLRRESCGFSFGLIITFANFFEKIIRDI